MRCINRNIKEFKVIRDEIANQNKKVNADVAATLLINKWQEATGNVESNQLPTLEEFLEFQDARNVSFNLKVQDFITSIYKNLDDRNYIHRRNGKWYVTKTRAGKNKILAQKQLADVVDGKGKTRIADINIKSIYRYLNYYNVPINNGTITAELTKDNKWVYPLNISEDLFLPQDIIEKSRGFNLPKSRKVALHLKKLFPAVNIEKVSVREAEKLYKQIPAYAKKKKVDFDNVTSFFYGNTAYLIDGRVTDETLIEEMLHPFVAAVQASNPTLYENLIKEARTNFPVLNAQIGGAYTESKGFTNEDIDQELVTQALTRHFKKEFETKPTKTFLQRIREFLEFFKNILRAMYKNTMGYKMVGKTNEDFMKATTDMIQKSMNSTRAEAEEILDSGADVSVDVSPGDIPSWATMSQMATFLNTDGIKFGIYASSNKQNVSNKVFYNLSDEKQKALDSIRETANDIQNEIIDQLFHTALIKAKDADFFSITNRIGNREVVVYDEKTKTYMDILNKGERYIGGEEAVKGRTAYQQMTEPGEAKEQKLNAIRSDFKTITEAIASGQMFDDIKGNLKELNNEQGNNAFIRLKENINVIAYGPEGTAGTRNVVIPQVIAFDAERKMASTVDLMIIEPISGKFKLINIAVNEFSQDNEEYNTKVELADDSMLKTAETKELSKAQQDYIQINLAARMLENMGYEQKLDRSSAITYHFKVNLEDNTYEFDGRKIHYRNDNDIYVDKLVPNNNINLNKEEVKETIKESDDYAFKSEDLDNILMPDEKLPENLDQDFIDPAVEMSVITGALQAYKKGLIKKRDAMDLLRSKVFTSKSTDKTKEDVLIAINQINTALGSGIKERNKLYSKMLFDSIKEIKKFRDFIVDPKNINDPDYITYVLNFNRFAATYEGLYIITDSKAINATQRSLLLQLRSLLTELSGEGGKNGLVTQAVEDYVKSIVREKSSYNFTEEELEAVIKLGAQPLDFIKDGAAARGKDQSIIEFGTKDLATSRDTLSAVADKIYKAKAIERNNLVKKKLEKNLLFARRLLRLSPEKDTQKLYTYMLQFDEQGVPTGRIIGKIGQQYYDLRRKASEGLYDENGNKKEYIEIDDIDEASQEDLAYNKALAAARAEFREFMQPETVGANNEPIDGRYHKYTAKFKRIRAEYEVWDSGRSKWVKRNDVSPKEYARYRARYYDDFEYTRAVKDSMGNYTGAIDQDIDGRAVRKEFTEAREVSRDGQDMKDKKYVEMLADDSELGRARLDYFNFWKAEFEGDLLQRLPRQQRDQMAGKIPVMRGNFMQDLSNKDPLVVKLWAKTTQSVKNMFTETMEQRVVYTDEEGKMVDALPIYFTGNAATEDALQRVEAEIDALKKDRQDGKIKIEKYDMQLKLLNGKKKSILSKPKKSELNLDLAASMSAFTEMAVHYDLMSGIEDSILAIKQVIENRQYAESDMGGFLGKYDPSGTFQRLSKKNSEGQSNTAKRFNKWLHMVYYDDEFITKGVWTKATEALIKYSSLSYVAFNPFGNFNNYALGRVQDNIEAIGERYFPKSAFARASAEFNKRALPDLVKRLAQLPSKEGADLIKSDKQYDASLPMSKYEAVVNVLYMMDKKADVRESGKGYGPKQNFWLWDKFQEIGYSMQDAAEYNVQTKVGIAMVIGTKLKSNKSGEIKSLYDVYQWDKTTGELKVAKEFDTVVEVIGKDANGNPITKERAFNDDFIYELRNKIREVNKQIHGNYAREDRMVIESYAWGRLLAQFHKWVAPAIRARYQREYYDENLGWMEGRWRSLMKGIRFIGERAVKGDVDFKNWQKKFLNEYGYTDGENTQLDQRAMNKLQGIYRSMGEAAFVALFLFARSVMEGMIAGDDDEEVKDGIVDDALERAPESDTMKRMQNFMAYQLQRTYKELILFVPLLGTEEQYQMVKSPIASTRTMGELGKALSLTVMTPLAYWAQDEEDFWNNSDYVYQRGKRAGELKLSKEWQDAVPILYAIKKWQNYIDQKDFFIK